MKRTINLTILKLRTWVHQMYHKGNERQATNQKRMFTTYIMVKKKKKIVPRIHFKNIYKSIIKCAKYLEIHRSET